MDVLEVLGWDRLGEATHPWAGDRVRYAATTPGSELVTYDGVGHSPFREVPDRFEAELRNFLASL